MNTQTLKGVVRYDGANFAGWQRQRHARTVQGDIEVAMARIARVRVAIQGAGRTDAGVHALGQVFSCKWPGEPPRTLRRALSQMLAPEIRIESLEPAAEDFNARFSARSKRYCYTFELSREADPLVARYAWRVPYLVDLGLIKTLLKKLEGEHDFKSFQSSGNQMESTVRTLFEARLAKGGVITPGDNPNLWNFSFHGDGFLYKMVRNMAGTLIEIGRGRLPADFIDAQLAKPGPFLGHCAPPHGLTMMRVFYEEPPAGA